MQTFYKFWKLEDFQKYKSQLDTVALERSVQRDMKKYWGKHLPWLIDENDCKY